MVEIHGPFFINDCGHNGYVGSFYLWKKGMQREYYDVYIFDVKPFAEDERQEVCIRYGDEPSEYISPGSVTEFISRKLCGEPHDSAIDLLKLKGKFVWSFNT